MAARTVWRTVLLALALSGCLASPQATDAPDERPTPDTAAVGFRFTGTDCVAGGGHSVHPKLPGYLPDPWLPADVQEDTGTPPLTTEFYAHPTQAVPADNDTMGNWHVTMLCDASTLDGRALADHVFGFVGMRVEPPPFDEGPPADRHYLTTVVASNDEALRGVLHGLGIHATDATGHAGLLDTGLFHNVLDTSDYGVYEAYFAPEPAGTMPGSFRLWFQRANDDGTFSPVALDVRNEGGDRLRAAQAYGTFSHLETEDHAPLPGAAGESPGLAYTGFSTVITVGTAPDVRLPEAYIHL